MARRKVVRRLPVLNTARREQYPCGSFVKGVRKNLFQRKPAEIIHFAKRDAVCAHDGVGSRDVEVEIWQKIAVYVVESRKILAAPVPSQELRWTYYHYFHHRQSRFPIRCYRSRSCQGNSRLLRALS